ncbi:MAG: hypothetical protein MUO82_01605 [Candidatus Thermoplasmatota archaeon]|nr:hypothetical protein [Candidatus Thermoplasmatota archaeon]
MIFGKQKKMKDDTLASLKEFEEMLIDMNKNGYIKNEELEEDLQKIKKLRDLDNKKYTLPELMIENREVEKEFINQYQKGKIKREELIQILKVNKLLEDDYNKGFLS